MAVESTATNSSMTLDQAMALPPFQSALNILTNPSLKTELNARLEALVADAKVRDGKRPAESNPPADTGGDAPLLE